MKNCYYRLKKRSQAILTAVLTFLHPEKRRLCYQILRQFPNQYVKIKC